MHQIDATPALGLLACHLMERAAPAQRIAARAEEAWQEWIDRPTLARAGRQRAGAWLDAERRQAAVLVAAALRPTGCTVELDPWAGAVVVCVGLA